MDEHHATGTALICILTYLLEFFLVCFIVCCIYWGYSDFMYLFMFFNCSFFNVFMLYEYHVSLVYCCCFILCMCVHIYVYTFIHYLFMYLVLFLFIVYFWLSFVWLLSCVFCYFDCFLFILYEYVCIHRYVFCFAFTYLHVFCFVWIDQSWCKYAYMSTCSGFWNRYGWNRSGSRWWLRTHIWEGEVLTEVNMFSMNMVCVYS